MSRIVAISNGSATTAALTWPGGRGLLAAVATWGGGSVKIQWLGPDESTYLDTTATSTLSANGSIVFELPPCTIKVVVATATGVYATIYSLRSTNANL